MRHLQRTGPPPPIRVVHLGLGGFFRSHQAWYTGRLPDAEEWGIAAFSGRHPELASTLDSQDGLYTLVERGSRGDRFGIVGSIARAHPATDRSAWLRYLTDHRISVVTLTVTEAAYRIRRGGVLDRTDPDVVADIEALRSGGATVPARTVLGRLSAGLLARRAADAGPLAIVSCDNVPDNGRMLAAALRDMAEDLDLGFAEWISDTVNAPTTVVDRITPKTTGEDVRVVREATGFDDRAPVVTEPFSEWVLSGPLPESRPRWEQAGATVTDDATPYEQRKLWLLNGAHSLLAYAGSLRGHSTVADAIEDSICRSWVDLWWAEATRHVPQPTEDVQRYVAALLDRFVNPRIQHRLSQIAADGSQKLPIRVLPVLRRERAAGRLPEGAAHILAAWVCHLRGAGVPVSDPAANELRDLASGPLKGAVPSVLRTLDAGLGDDADLVTVVEARARELGTK